MLYLEIVLILGIIGFQLVLYIKNRQKAAALAGFFPQRKSLAIRQLQVEGEGSGGGGSYQADQLVAEQASESFQEMLHDANTYLKKNQGSASFTVLKELAERPLELQSAAAGANVSTPLYIGLLGTFLGIALGLLGIVEAGVNEASIQSFLAGVLVAMLGSFGGLLFTVLSNFRFRQAQQEAGMRQQGYLSFLQAHLLPRLEQDMAGSLNNLRTVLDQFNQDFFQKIIDFKEVFSNLSQYVSVQEKFLTSLESGGYNQLTEANLRFLEQIRENAQLFESFGGYQRKLNESLQLGAEAARDIREIVERLRSIDDVQAYIRQNEEMLRRQVGYLTTHQDRMEDLSNSIQQHFIEAGDEIGKLVRERMQILQREEQDAGEALRAHFARLQQENVYQKIADQLQPIRQMEKEVESLSETSRESSRMLLQTSEYLMKKINQDGRLHQALMDEIGELNRQMSLLNEKRNWWQKLWSKEGEK